MNEQTKPILVAIIANTIIAISKAIGYFFSGSSALLSETIHSFADVMNQALLFLGIKRGEKSENEIFHYGFSQERFFWNLVSAMGIFVLGCGVTVYHGVHNLLHPSPVGEQGVEQIVIQVILIISLLVESYSFYVATYEIKKQANLRSKTFFTYLDESLDPSVSAVFWEDLAAIIGILLALVGIFLTNLTGDKTFDSIASILIGLLMGWIAYHLAIENKKFLIDKSIPEFEMNELMNVLNNTDVIQSSKEVKTVVLGPDRLKMSARIELDVERISDSIIKATVLEMSKNKVDLTNPQNLENVLSEFSERIIKNEILEFRKIEKKLQEKLPNLKHIDLTL